MGEEPGREGGLQQPAPLPTPCPAARCWELAPTWGRGQVGMERGALEMAGSSSPARGPSDRAQQRLEGGSSSPGVQPMPQGETAAPGQAAAGGRIPPGREACV